MTDGWDPRNDGWLAGFADGEATFTLPQNNSGRQIHPQFSITLRADDFEVLEALQAAFGGTLHYDPCKNKSERWGWKTQPQWRWRVGSKRDLPKLLMYFDRFPLHAKKARDYVVWRRAAQIYCVCGGSDGRLFGLRATLMAGRAFEAPDAPDLDDPFEPQMALGID